MRIDAVTGAREQWILSIDETVTRLDGEQAFGELDPASFLVDVVVDDVEGTTGHLDVLVGTTPSAGARVFAHGGLSVDDRGGVVDSAIDFVERLPDGTLEPVDVDVTHSPYARVVANLPRCFVPLPDEPVGVGAEWHVVEHAEQDGIQMTRRSEYELGNSTAKARGIGGRSASLGLSACAGSSMQHSRSYHSRQ